MAAASSSSHQQGPLLRFDCQSNTSKTMVSSKLYDAFISHRGPDIKHTLALQLYNHIQDANCRAFLDSQEFEAGDSIPSTIRDAICSSSVQIAIFTKGYADSPWCLDELVLMLQQRRKSRFIPVFYGVRPWNLRYLDKGVYADAFNKYVEKGRWLNKLEAWKDALHSVSEISGYDFDNYSRNHEKQCTQLVKEEKICHSIKKWCKGLDCLFLQCFINHEEENEEEIVHVEYNLNNEICRCTTKLCEDIATAVVKAIARTKPLRVAKSPVGLDVLVADFESHVFKNREEEKIIGIFGMGGIGKTTLSKEFFNRRRSEYSAACFLFDVREADTKNELPSLQRKLLKDLFHQEYQFQHIDEGYNYMSRNLKRLPMSTLLIVIDDIDNQEQLNRLLPGDDLTRGSLVLVTTRDESVLKRAKITCLYKMQEMDLHNSTELFCQHAFGTVGPATGYEDLVRSFVEACGGLPLSLEVLGSHVSGGDKHYWQGELTKARNTLPKESEHVLKISIDALDNEEKQIFMDIACFFISTKEDIAMSIWKGSGWINAEHALQTLKDRCLVTVKEEREEFRECRYILGMHDHVRDLGRKIAGEQISPRRPRHPTNLKSPEGTNFQNVLDETSGQTLRCLHTIFGDNSVYKNGSVDITYFLGNVNHCAERKTNLLWLYLRVHQAKMETAIIPSWIPLQNLQCLIIFGCGESFEKLWQSGSMAPFQLKKLKLCRLWLEEFSYSLLQMSSHLEELELRCIYNIGGSFLESLRKLTKLKSLVLISLKLNGELVLHKNRDVESPMVRLHKIQIINVKLLKKISVSTGHCPNLQSLILDSLPDLVEVDLSPSCYELKLKSCVKLETISKFPDLQAPFQLKELKLYNCSLQEFPYTLLRMLNHLEELELNGRDHKSISIEGGSFSDSVSKLTKLRSLVLTTLTLNGELAFYKKSRDAVSHMESLEEIKIVNAKLLEKVSVSAEHCPSLQSLILQKLDDLAELDLSTSCYELRSCKNSKMNPKLPDLAMLGCSEEEEFLRLNRIQIIVCLKLHYIRGIENLERLNFLLIEAGNGGIRKCIQRLQRVPADYMTVMGTAVNGAESRLNAELFSALIGRDAVFEFYERVSLDSQPHPEPLSAVFVCVVVEKLLVGKCIVTTVLHDEKEIASEGLWPRSLFNHIDHLPLEYYSVRAIKGCIVRVNKKEEWKAVEILKTIIEQLHRVEVEECIY